MANMRNREQLAKEIEKTSESIRKKHRALKAGRIEEDIAMEKRFKPIVEPLKQIAEHTEESQPIKREAKDIKREVSKNIKKRRADSDDDDGYGDEYWLDNKWLKLSSVPGKGKHARQSNVTSDRSPMLHSTTIESPIEPSAETSAPFV